MSGAADTLDALNVSPANQYCTVPVHLGDFRITKWEYMLKSHPPGFKHEYDFCKHTAT